MHNDENGYIVVETIGTFIPFVFVIVSILSLVNIVTLQSRVHNALTQTANTLSMYSYTLEVTGVANNLTTLDNKADKVTKGINEMKSDINGILEGIESLSYGDVKIHGEAAAERLHSWGESIGADPMEVLQLVMNYTISEGFNELFQLLVEPLVSVYLSNGDMTGEEYLKSVNVIDGLDFEDSILIDKDGNVKLVVNYEIEYKFGALPLPFEPKLKVSQTVKTKAWLNGSGKGYW